MGAFEDAVDALLYLLLAQATLLLLTPAVTPPLQTSITTPTGCLASYADYLHTAQLRLYLVTCLFTSLALGTFVKAHLRLHGGLLPASAAAKARRRCLRGAFVLAVLLSAAATAVALAAYQAFLQISTVLDHCVPDRRQVVYRHACFAVMGLVGIAGPTCAFIHCGLTASE